MEFKDKLKELREDKKLSQEKFAKELNVTRGAVGNWELGSREPNIKMLIKLADFFSVTTDELLGREK